MMEFALATLFEPIDWLLTVRDLLHGDLTAVIGFLPLIPGSARHLLMIGDNLPRSMPDFSVFLPRMSSRLNILRDVDNLWRAGGGRILKLDPLRSPSDFGNQAFSRMQNRLAKDSELLRYLESFWRDPESVPGNIALQIDRIFAAEMRLMRTDLLEIINLDDIYRRLQPLGIPGLDREQLEQIRNYLLDSDGIDFTGENYIFWQRLNDPNYRPTVDDAALFVHEIAEINALRAAGLSDVIGLRETNGNVVFPDQFVADYYLPAHSGPALQSEYQYLETQVNRICSVAKIEWKQAAANGECCRRAP